MVQIINTTIGDVLSKAEIKIAGKKMSKKIVAEMKIMYDAASAMTVLVNKEFGKTYFQTRESGLQMTKKMKKQAKVRMMRQVMGTTTMTKNQVLQNKTPRSSRYKWVRGSINK